MLGALSLVPLLFTLQTFLFTLSSIPMREIDIFILLTLKATSISQIAYPKLQIHMFNCCLTSLECHTNTSRLLCSNIFLSNAFLFLDPLCDSTTSYHRDLNALIMTLKCSVQTHESVHNLVNGQNHSKSLMNPQTSNKITVNLCAITSCCHHLPE